MSGFASPPPNYDTRAPGIVACAVVMIIASSLAVILRFWSRAVAARLKFWWDDWAMLATLVDEFPLDFELSFVPYGLAPILRSRPLWWASIGRKIGMY